MSTMFEFIHTFDTNSITEPVSKYFFYTDYRNNFYGVVPLFTKTTLKDVASVFVHSLHHIMMFLVKASTMITTVCNQLFTTTINTKVHAVTQVIQTMLSPLYIYLQSRNLFSFTFLDKFVIAVFTLYLITKVIIYVTFRNNCLDENLQEKISAMEHQIIALKRHTYQLEEDLTIVSNTKINMDKLFNNFSKSIMDKIDHKLTSCENRVQKQMNKLQKKVSEYN
jgi:hypothetical protein